VARLINAKYGTDYDYPDIQKMAIDCLKAERKFNDLAGLPADRCDIPEFMREEPLPPKNNVFDIPRGEIEDIFTYRGDVMSDVKVIHIKDVKGEKREPPRVSWILVSEKTVGSKNLAVGINETARGGMVPEHKHETEEEVMLIMVIV